MTRRPYTTLVIILLLVAFAAWVDLSKQINISNPFNGKPFINRNTDIRLGLDLRGGLQVLLEADLPANTSVNSNDLATTRQILENRANGLGVSEVVMQSAPPNRIVAQFPGLQNSDQVVASLQETGLLEFVDFGSTHLAEGTVIQTDFGTAGAGPSGIVTPTPTSSASPTPAPTETATATAVPGATPQATATDGPGRSNHLSYGHDGYFASSSVNVETGADGRNHRLCDRFYPEIRCHPIRSEITPARTCGQIAGDRPGQKCHFSPRPLTPNR